MPNIRSPLDLGDIVTVNLANPEYNETPFRVIRRYRTRRDVDDNGYNAYYVALEAVDNPQVRLTWVHTDDTTYEGRAGDAINLRNFRARQNTLRPELYSTLVQLGRHTRHFYKLIREERTSEAQRLWRSVEDLFHATLQSSQASGSRRQDILIRFLRARTPNWANAIRLCSHCNSAPIVTHYEISYQRPRPVRHNFLGGRDAHHYICHNCAHSNDFQERGGLYYTQSELRGLMRELIQRYPANVLDVHTPKYLPHEKGRVEDWKTHPPLLLGVELEVATYGSPWDIPQKVIDTLPFVILKHDASINEGFEIVSAPATLAFHKVSWNDFFKGPASELREDNSCGLHVHVSRDAISPLTLGRLLHFINFQENTGFISEVAGRNIDEIHWCKAKPKKLKDVAADDRDKYTALNVSKEETAEYRIFATTLDRTIFLARVEFCVAAIDFATATSNQQLTAKDFLAFLRERKDLGFGNLRKYLSNLGYTVSK